MSGDLADYATHFQEGTRVRVGIPLAEGGDFQEWGRVASLEDDLLELDLSRDTLPKQALLRLGGVVELKLIEGEVVRGCRGMVAEESGHRLMLRLIEGVVLFEPREYFRQDVYLPLDFRLPPAQDATGIKERWRNRLWAHEFAAQQPEPGESQSLEPLRLEIRRELAQKKAAPPVAANIGGGGVRLNIARQFTPGTLLELSVYLPEPEKVLEMVGEVVQVRPLPDGVRFSTALSFRFIDEADRDRLIGHVSAQQLQQLSRMAPRWPEPERLSAHGRRRNWAAVIVVALLAGFVGCQIQAIRAHRESGKKHEIQRIFDEAVGKYLRQRQ